ncbi:MAG TPA: nuclear transport factor 2 family protein [Candidatus Saccharibacteria bacterium]|nr:nuclear transport factor 2 family protein [Candidatus Saccharibacteria bacterium]
MNVMETAKLYFELSNKSDFDNIEKLFTDKTVYISQATGEYVGKKDIIAMQRNFHGQFSSLNWRVTSVKEVKPGVILFDFDFVGEMLDGEVMKTSGQETVTVSHDKIIKIVITKK